MIPLIDPKLERYAAVHSTPPTALLAELEAYTKVHCQHPEMVVGGLEGGFLKMLTRLSGAQRVVEIGLFTGYSALSIAEALPDDGELISCDIDAESAAIAQSFFDRSPHGHKIAIQIGPALDTLRHLVGGFDLAFLDADKTRYVSYYEALMPMLNRGGLLVADNVLWSGRVLAPETDADLALVAFNTHVDRDPRVDNILLPLRDGVMLARKI
ncbi:MAG: class I SAM-dependent methyltransferase [Gammaproteobacteria bacterium]|nr:class I SAM-dependent methyltransferase [Gammaproteobacteria bacterium]